MSRIDRRALFTSGAAAALLAATGASLDAAPRRGGILRLAVPRDGALLEAVALASIYDSLTEIGPDGVLKGELATSWHSNSDARIWHLQLRDDAVFHDGAAMSAADVVASLLAHNLPVKLRNLTESAQGEIRIELSQPNPDLPYILADPKFFVARGGKIEAPLETANGTGLYRLMDMQSDRQFRADRVAHHYKDGNAGWVDRIDVIAIPDAGVRAQALREGFVDVVALPDVDGLLKQGEFRYFPSAQEMTLAAHRDLGLPRRISTRSPLDDGRIAERWWAV